jgi:hypothetical protein
MMDEELADELVAAKTPSESASIQRTLRAIDFMLSEKGGQ